jgi:6-phospho-beta-glucosidase
VSLRLVVLGGSGASTPELFDALAAWPGGVERRPPLTVVLVGRSAAKLELVAAECRRRVAGLTGERLEVQSSTDRQRALDGAGVVLDQVRVGGLEARAFDETFPWAFGIPGEETMGPGGMANALRTLPVLRQTWQEIAEWAPDPLVVNLTNPAGIVHQAARREFDLRIVGACDSPVAHVRAIAVRLGRPIERVTSRYVGMNHVGWYVPEDRTEIGTLADLAVGQDPEAVAVQEAVGAPYVRYYIHPDRILTTQRAAAETRAAALQRLETDMLGGYERAEPATVRRGAAWYGLAIVPYLDAWLHGSAGPLIAGVANEGRLEGVPDGAMVELPVVVATPGAAALPLEPVPLPPFPAALLAAHAAYETLTVDAILGGSTRRSLVRALLANPLVTSLDQAARLVDAILAGSPR